MIIRSAVMNIAGLWLVLMGLVFVGTEGQNITIVASENPLVIEGLTSARINCKNMAANSENANLQWIGPSGQQIGSNQADKVYTTNVFEPNSLSLIFTNPTEDEAGMYHCKGTINGTPQNTSIRVEVDMPLIVTDEMAPKQQEVTEGINDKIECIGPGGYTVAWSRQGNPITPQAYPRYAQVQDGLEITNVNASVDEGWFKCTVFKAGSNKLKFIDIYVTVIVPPIITNPPSSGQAVVGAEHRFTCLATGKPAPEYRWFKDSSSNELAGDRFEINKQAGILVINSVIKDDEGEYKCDARNEAGTVFAKASLNVIIPPKITEYNNATGEEGNDAVLRCKAYGDPIPTIKWFKGESIMQDASATQDVNEKTVVSQLTITSLSKESGGQYTCEATTQNAPSDSKHIFLIVKYKPAFSPDMETTAWTWKNAPGNLTCIVSGENRPNVQWYSTPDENGNRNMISEGSFFSISTKYPDANTVKSILRVAYDFTTPLGDYLCKASNDLGSTNRTITLRKANPPSQPAIQEIEVTPNTAEYSIRFSSVSNAPPPKRLKVTITASGSSPTVEYYDVGNVNGIPKEVIVNLRGLTPSTSYTFEFAGESDAGEGQSRSVPKNTPAPRQPYKVEIKNQLRDGEFPTKYNLEWETPKDGGSPIKYMKICSRRVKVRPELSPTNEYQFEEQITGFACQEALPNQSTFELRNLEPSTHYQVDVKANNDIGDSPSSFFIFKTKSDKPTPTASSNTESDDGIPLGVIIAIIIIAFIILFIVVDVTCYYKKRCGVIMCFKEKFCGGSSAGAGGAKDAEKGGDEENTKPLLKTEEEEKNGKEEELKEMEPEEKEKGKIDAEKSPTIENAEEAKPAPESPKQPEAQAPNDTKPEEKSPTTETKTEAPAGEKKEEK